MNGSDPIGLLFGGMEKLGPGGNAQTLAVLRLLPKQQFRVVVDAGCGTGRQTLALAKELGTLVHAVDSYEPFLDDLVRRAREARVEQLVQTCQLLMPPCRIIACTWQKIAMVLWSTAILEGTLSVYAARSSGHLTQGRSRPLPRSGSGLPSTAGDGPVL